MTTIVTRLYAAEGKAVGAVEALKSKFGETEIGLLTSKSAQKGDIEALVARTGVPKAAAAIFTPEGKAEVKAMTDFYLENAALIRKAVVALGFTCIGGDNAPYIWVNTGTDSWAFFDKLLNEAQVVCTPGAGFGKCGEGHVRISAFNSRENVEKALVRIAAALGI